ncbi:hypothetical protein [Actinokineospora diospyrosa]|uniref:DUF2637 domain-containing protein n=1 Tax=Actinokineospora diospyrosa TaxID=103728 RepID=A0ABT1IFJ2_9PSEU|nr:hypothetical protein [Actinokineospora diospyrosa]MCP2271400.1 hypothetical protein [Actinokineospora diospyrosa]
MSTPTEDRARRLVQDAAAAAQARAYQTHPDVVALRVEQVRTQVDRLCWAGIGLGLAFTMTNVQQFAAGGAPPWTVVWLAAWLLDPTVSLVLLAILRAEQVTARYRVRTGPWVHRAKWATLAATYVMNTWASYAAGSVSGVVLHSVPVMVVFVAAEAITDLRDKLTETVTAAFAHASHLHRTAHPEPVVDHTDGAMNVPDPVMNAAPVHEQPDGPGPRPRKLLADYVADARAKWSPGVSVTPAWARSVTGCSRGLSSRVAAEVNAGITADGDHDGTATVDITVRRNRGGGVDAGQ